MKKFVAVTNRTLCYELHPEYEMLSDWGRYEELLREMEMADRKMCTALLIQLEKLAGREDVEFIILREKDLELGDYMVLANEALKICRRLNKELVVHYYYEAACMSCRVINENKDVKLGLHLPLWKLKELTEKFDSDSTKDACRGCLGKYKEDGSYRRLGVSVHSAEEAVQAQELGATYLVVGNIYETDCKKGLAGRGLDFLKELCDAVSVPVYAIGGITAERLPDIERAGAAGGCMMSSAMR